MDESPLLQAARSLVDAEILPGVSYAVLKDGRLVDAGCCGWADRERGIALRDDAIFRGFSNTKLATSCAALLLMQDGRFELDDPIAEWLPAFAEPRVLRAGARSVDDSVPCATPITIRHLLTHTAGFTGGIFDPGLLHDAVHARRVRDPAFSLAQMAEALAALPLQFEPGSGWQYSLATDVLARLVEVVGGERFGDFLARRIFEPLGMVDTGFVLESAQRERFTALYGAANPADASGPGLRRLVDVPYAGAWERPVARQSGSGGLFMTRADMLALLRALLPAEAGGAALLKPATIAEAMRNQLAAGLRVRFAFTGALPSMGHGLAGAVTIAAPGAERDTLGEMQWGGLGGTHWWVAPRAQLAGVLMTHRHMAFWHPFWFDWKRRAHAAHALADPLPDGTSDRKIAGRQRPPRRAE
jgi:CubicO group peptidase (beta-lactamase class C family)